ncbi:MAG TPA: ABC transporter permease [Gaiellaceae bacterium]|jgi:peptide/nickel transport system permease protein|nr:ABC transporter permease [Gaiellaceae bacterium]
MTVAEPPPVAATPALEVVDHARLARRERIRLIVRSKTFLIGAAVLGFWILMALLGSTIAPHDPYADDILNKLKAPSGTHWFGTDSLGRDVFSRVLAGARGIIVVALLATVLGTAAGTAFGLAAGYFRGLVDEILGILFNAFLSLPVVIIGLLALVAVGPSKLTVTLVVGVVFTPIISRTVRAAVLAERQLEYVQAARLRNERPPYVMFAEILPNVLAPILVEFTVRLGYAIFAIATLSFLGVGIPPPAPDWGVQIADHYGLISGGYWWPSLFPALAIASLVISVNLVADGLTHAFER